ncbi:MAG TPA: DUF2283 domain-containing protein [Candidatus Nanoarchaeia archaeon]|nr:DUF2283 domain-containing protein [Candidatus Nanoarchaeia archaeon]
MTKNMEMRYDEEADYLEIFVGEPREDYGEHISKDIVIFKYEDNGQLYGVGIFNFKKRASDLKDVLSKLPVSIKIESN